jgi:4-nitrophenyl phosphatase
MRIENIKTLLIDGDGVLWRSDQAMPGFERFFNTLDQQNIEWALLTNNNTRTAAAYVEKLKDFGIAAEQGRVFTSSTVTAEYLLNRYGKGAPVHVVGMSGLIDTVMQAGLSVTTGEEKPTGEVVAVAAGMDREINYEKITIAMQLILDGAEFVATNMDASFPTSDGFWPGTGAIIGALIGATGQEPVVIGKPEPAIYKAAMSHFDANPGATAMLGDRLETDILGAQRAGIGTIMVLTGVATREDIELSPIKPEHVFENISTLAQALEES